MISWMIRKQKYVALSTSEVEYIVASIDSCKEVWLRKLFGEMFEQVLDTIVIYCDNKSHNISYFMKIQADRDMISLHSRHAAKRSH